jgi:NAD(P)-dependent dehydrogenase (short-subunit alcohol dehydrogenase family)
MTQRVAVVTGANRGIGQEVVRQLARQGLTVVLTSRNEEKGLQAAEELQKQKLPVRFHVLDVTDPSSIRNLALFMAQEFKRCDVLVNNAGIFPDREDASVFNAQIETIKDAMQTNVYGPILLCQALIPLMRRNKYGRIVNFSSGMGQLTDMNGGSPAYRISKTSINAVTRIFTDELKGENILVNSMCPGWVKTEMGGPGANRSVEDGADTAVWLATLPDEGPRGGFFRDRRPIAW